MFKKKIKANCKFFQLPTSTYRFVLTAFTYPNIALVVILFLVDIVP